MVIVETSVFTRQIQALLKDDDYRRLQTALVIRPDLGDLIPVVGAYARCAGTHQAVVNGAVCG
jgi:hypothetical protein